MNQKSFNLTVGIVFVLITILHLLRITFGWSAIIAGWVVPEWVSWAAMVVAGFLAYEGFRLSKSTPVA
jgi:hypothetical protein